MLGLLGALVIIFIITTALLKYHDRFICVRVSDKIPMNYLSILVIHESLKITNMITAENRGSKTLLPKEICITWRLCWTRFILLVLPSSVPHGKISVLVGCFRVSSKSLPYSSSDCSRQETSSFENYDNSGINNESDKKNELKKLSKNLISWSHNVVDSVESTTSSHCNMNIYNNTCTVCLEDLLFSEEQFSIACGHAFHYNCFVKMILQVEFLTCPYCKHPFVECCKIFEDIRHEEMKDQTRHGFYGSTIVTTLQAEAQDISTLL